MSFVDTSARDGPRLRTWAMAFANEMRGTA